MRSETSNMLEWKNLDGQQKYEIVELARKPETSVTDLCKTFQISRKTLYRAMDIADAAAAAALTAKPKGRPPNPVMQKEVKDLHVRNRKLESDLKRERLKNEVAQALLELHRKVDRQERLSSGKKTRGKPNLPRTSGSDGSANGS